MKKYVRLALFLALAIVLNIAESFVPFFNGIVPGLKIGLANIVVLFVLYYYSIKEAIFVSLLRVLVVGLLRTGLFSIPFIFSLTGAILALIFMYLAHRFFKFSVIGVSVVGSVMHTIGQLICVAIIFNTANLSFYIPVVILISLPTGIIVGYLADKIIDIMCKVDQVTREDKVVFEEITSEDEEPSVEDLIDVTQKIPTLKELVESTNKDIIETKEEPQVQEESVLDSNIEKEEVNTDEVIDEKKMDEEETAPSNITEWDMPVEEKKPKKKSQTKKTTTNKNTKKSSKSKK